MTKTSIDEANSSEKAENQPVSETQQLRNEVNDLKNMMAQLLSSMVAKTNENETKPSKPKSISKPRVTQPKKEREFTPERVIKDIPSDQYIKVVSLCDDKLNLRTKPYADKGGNTFSFQKFGETKQILYRQLLEIIEVHPNFFNNGYFYIFDEDVIAANGWGEVYSKLLSKEQIEKILSNTVNASSLFESANPIQREVIINFLVGKIVEGKQVDYNLINKLASISKVDISGRAQAIIENNNFLKNEAEKEARKNEQ